ncbi:hypothetical protein AHF37_03641 [Paragonimus kellicotti]|nr:hypothetical protein AHF37_03641 [Paragonimus kellicotti]
MMAVAGLPAFDNDEDIINNCTPIEIPPPPQPAQAVDARGPRLMITKIDSENFKSYGGFRSLGPFHKNFSCIIGPNGSGKSNVIDSMLFVFGYRATKVRSKKLSQLIHHSETVPNASSCMVAVHFQKIIEHGPEPLDYEVVPNSSFVVTRRAYRDNSSTYWIDNTRAVYRDVAALLRSHGVDLDHNRFLILQGEVEQIALMKPKAPSEHEDGFLEYLEDIIGSSRFKQPLAIFADRIERLNDLRLEKLTRVKAVEKEKDELEGVRNEAMGYLRLVNQVIRMKNILFQQNLAKERAAVSETNERIALVQSECQADTSRGRVFNALLEAKRAGSLPGILGRLGDLAAIPSRYDVAISTACSALDHIVTDTMDTAQQAVTFLKQNNLGLATFIGLDKMQKWTEKSKAHFTLPNGDFQVQRLYDLVQTVDDTVKPALYFALRDTLVTDSMDTALKVAFSQRQRHRVVTLQGQLIETSGAMSGGGGRPLCGRMLTSLAQVREYHGTTKACLGAKPVSVDLPDLPALERQLATGDADLARLRENRARLEEVVTRLSRQRDEAERTAKRCEAECARLRAEVATLTAEADRAQERANSIGPSAAEQKRLQAELQKLEKTVQQKCDQAAKKRAEVESLKTELLDVGSVRLTAVRSRLDAIDKKTKETNDQLTKLEVSVKTAARNYEKAQTKVANMETELEAAKIKLTEVDVKLKELEENARVCMVAFQKIQADPRGAFVSRLTDTILFFCLLTYLIRLPTRIREELAVDMQEMRSLEDRLASMAPNMAAIEEFRRKAEIYLTRVDELNHVTTVLGEQRKQMEDAKAKRLSEFLDGFHAITAKLKEMYQMITQGGDAELELIDSLDPFSEGIVFSVRPPKKSWKNIANLSGGEKTLSSLALVFALHHYKPTPLYVMDEIDAALDFKNVSIVGNYLKERTRNAQFIVISLRNNMFELADRLVGIYKTQNVTKTITLDHARLTEQLSKMVVRVATAHGREKDLLDQQQSQQPRLDSARPPASQSVVPDAFALVASRPTFPSNVFLEGQTQEYPIVIGVDSPVVETAQ